MVRRDHIGRLRKEMGLGCKQKQKFKATTNSKRNLPTVPNLLDQAFSPQTPGMVWGTDITYIPTDEGWLYLSGVKDFGSEELVGWAMADRMTKGLVRAALAKALAFRVPLPGCIHHSDRGSQYCSREYRRDVDAAGFRASMSRKGNCYDNAPTESLQPRASSFGNRQCRTIALYRIILLGENCLNQPCPLLTVQVKYPDPGHPGRGVLRARRLRSKNQAPWY